MRNKIHLQEASPEADLALWRALLQMRFKIHLQEASPEAPIAQGIPSLGGIMHFSMMGGVTQSGYITIMIQMLK